MNKITITADKACAILEKHSGCVSMTYDDFCRIFDVQKIEFSSQFAESGSYELTFRSEQEASWFLLKWL